MVLSTCETTVSNNKAIIMVHCLSILFLLLSILLLPCSHAMVETHLVFIECLKDKEKLYIPITFIGTPLLKQLIASSCSQGTDVNGITSKINRLILEYIQTNQLRWRLDKDEITFVPPRNHYDELLQIRIGKGTVGHEFIDYHFSSHCELETIHSIGRFTQITGNISIMTNAKCHQRPAQYDFDRLWHAKSTPVKPSDTDLSRQINGSVVIGNDVWIGPDVVIHSGVSVGDGAVLEARAVITEDVPPYAIVIGNPARVVSYRFDETIIKQMLDIHWWTWSSQQILHAVESGLLRGDDMSLFLKIFGQKLPASVLTHGVESSCGDERKKVCFHINNAGERGVEISTYDYAEFLEIYYGDRFTSVFLFPRIKAVTEGLSFPKFQRRFPIVLYDVEHEKPGGWNLTMAARSTKCDVLYMQKGGSPLWEPVYPDSFHGEVPTIVHAVFAPWEPHGTIYAGIGKALTSGGSGRLVVPYMVRPFNASMQATIPLPTDKQSLRHRMGINNNTFVMCRIGGKAEFNIDFVHSSLVELASMYTSEQFQVFFVNTDDTFTQSLDTATKGKFHFLPATSDPMEKELFFDSCDAMIHARLMGETFGLAVAEFSVRNKPVITFSGKGASEYYFNEHLNILGAKAFTYDDSDSLKSIISTFINSGVPKRDYHAYTDYYPESVMKMFKSAFLDPIFNTTSAADGFHCVNNSDDDKSHKCADHTDQSPPSVRIIDSFTFYNELDILSYRLHLLADVVDMFVLVEATHTFSGLPKPLVFLENSERFAPFLHQIVHVIVDDMPYVHPNIDYEQREQWHNDFHQFDCLTRGWDSLQLRPSDLVMISNVDEIPHPRLLRNLKVMNDTTSFLRGLDMAMYYYNLNTKVEVEWQSSKILSYEMFQYLSMSCHRIRNMSTLSIPHAGWHLSYFGDSHFIQTKISSFGHQEFNLPMYTTLTAIEEKIKQSKDLYGRGDYIVRRIAVWNNTELPCHYEKYLSDYVLF